MSIVIGGGAFVITYMTALMWPMMTAGSRPRSTEWDAESPFAGKLEEFLHEEEGYERLTVKGIKSPFDGSVGLAILGLKPNFTEATLHAVLPHTLKELNDIELIGPLILAELKIDEAKARERKIGYRVLAIAVPFLAIGMAWMFLTREIDDAVIGLFQVFIVYLIIAFIPMGYMVYWRRKELKRVELEIAMKYPRYREALQILVNKHHTLPYGTTSYRARLKHINEALGLDTYRPPDDDGLGLE
jgi:hypothetical protein